MTYILGRFLLGWKMKVRVVILYLWMTTYFMARAIMYSLTIRYKIYPQIKNVLHQARKQVLGRGISLDSGIGGGKRCIR